MEALIMRLFGSIDPGALELEPPPSAVRIGAWGLNGGLPIWVEGSLKGA